MARITTHPNGDPVVEGTQASALAILLCFMGGADEAEIRSKFPGLPSGALSAVLRWNAAGRPLPDTSEALK